jgi:cystathionine beta-lyase
MKPWTKILTQESTLGDRFHPTSTPIYQTATFLQEEPDAFGEYDYSRSGNPTRTVLERQLSVLEGASHSYAFASGVAALSCVLALAEAGDTVLAGLDLYGGTYRLLEKCVSRYGVKIHYAASESRNSEQPAFEDYESR